MTFPFSMDGHPAEEASLRQIREHLEATWGTLGAGFKGDPGQHDEIL